MKNRLHPEKQAAKLGYRVSEDGLTVTRPTNRIVPQQCTRDGYNRFTFGPKCNRLTIRTHRLQAFQSFGDALYQEGIVCRHLDGNPLNNAASNIALGTQSQNMMDRPKECRQRCAFNASRSIVKHDHSAVVEFYKEHGFKATLAHFAISSRGTLSFILNKSATAPNVPMTKRVKRKTTPCQPT